jgi:hypothetical protein
MNVPNHERSNTMTTSTTTKQIGTVFGHLGDDPKIIETKE